MQSENGTPNHLIHETSPYLLQHAFNPVDWYPWGDAAFEKARLEDKPILLSCGYSACHWCHVMEKECFEDQNISALMNEHFVNIKVDREERPDIDQLYQQAVQMITGQGGWPLTVFLDHERKPFFGGTYFPPVPRYSMVSFPQILQSISKKWIHERKDIHDQAVKIFLYLSDSIKKSSYKNLPSPELPVTAVHQMVDMVDEINGGFGGAPKFPNTVQLQLFLDTGLVHKQSLFVDHVLLTLDKMCRGGIYDQIGGGFHRYATDSNWLVPHFEKMLYENASLLKLYVAGYQISKLNEFKRVVFETADYVHREMTSPQGGFFSSQDADSEGIEGKYFFWDMQEIKQVLDGEKGQLFIEYYNVTEEGNFEGHNILNRIQTSDKKTVLPPELIAKVRIAEQKLFKVREQRVKPFRDEKIITGWNGLMVSALSCAYQVFKREKDYRLARNAANFILDSIKLPNGNLGRVYKDDQVKIEAMLDDYSFLTMGLIDLYETDFDPYWLKKSLELTKISCEKFGSADGFYSVATDSGSLAVNPVSGADEALPSGISVHCGNLLKLASLTDNNELYYEAERILSAYNSRLEQDLWAYAGLINHIYPFTEGYNEFVFIGEDNKIPGILTETRQHYIPYRSVLYRNKKQGIPDVDPVAAMFRNRDTLGGKPTCYICSKKSCTAPITTCDELKVRIEAL
jgi:uncharacterized protein YyaL (SSP411 family)